MHALLLLSSLKCDTMWLPVLGILLKDCCLLLISNYISKNNTFKNFKNNKKIFNLL